METTERSSYDLVVELLNQASLERTGPSKVILLKQVQELIIHKEPNLLDNFFDEMLGFQSDKSLDVRKFVITFLEHACRIDSDILSKIIGNINILLYDENVNIKKKVILSMASLYKTAIKWIAQAKIVTEVMEETWKYMTQMKEHIVKLLDDDNDGIRTHSVKFCEAVVMVLSSKSMDSAAKDEDQSVEMIPEGEHFLNREKLEAVGSATFKSMLDFLGSQSITSVNLMACLTSMTNIAKKRPQFMTQVIQGFESLHVDLPPTLSNSQVSSVRKSLKLQMLAVLKHPSAADMVPQIATLLTDLGATQSEVSKAMPKPSELAASRKRNADSQAELQRSKKAAKTSMPALPVIPDVDDEEDEGPAPKQKDTPKPFNPVEVTTNDIIPKLNNNNVADLVLLSMVMLPDEMPAHFMSTYTPIAAAGTPGQIKHISRLLAVQLSNVGLGKGVEEQKLREEEELKKKEAEKKEETSSIAVVGDPAASTGSSIQPKAQFMVPMSGTTSKRNVRAYDLETVTKPLALPIATNLITMAMQRIMKAEGEANKANLSAVFCKIAAGLTSQFGGYIKEMMYEFILSDCKNRADLALAWVYNEYVKYHGFTLAEGGSSTRAYTDYEECLVGLLVGLLEMKEIAGAAALFVRLILESPHLPDSSIDTLKRYCTDQNHMYIGMNTLSELILKRPIMSTKCLYVLLDFTYNEVTEVRNTAIQVVKDLYENHEKLRHLINEFCRSQINNLLQTNPTISMFPALPRSKFETHQQPWTEFFIKQSLYLYLSILPDEPSYTGLLADIYVKATSDIKRVILRLMEAPIKQMGMDSPELLHFIRNSPKGSETLITRIIHILTERQAPSAELVEIVKDLYKQRVADVRFIIPVLSGLQKSEIIAALPRLIKLSPAIVKEVFNRLLGVGGHVGQDAALTPSELMVALHNIDPSLCDIKSIIKATTMCFQEKTLFTQEVLAVVIQQLMEVTPIPTLLMRTIIQSLTMYPKLQGFILNMLQRLIQKQVWKHKKLWEGFVRCCQRAKPQSFQILLQLAPAQLKMAFETAPELRQPLLKHINSFSAHQRAHLPRALLAVIEQREDQPADVKTEVRVDTQSIVKAEPIVKSEPESQTSQKSMEVGDVEPQEILDSHKPGVTSGETQMETDMEPPGVDLLAPPGEELAPPGVEAMAPPGVETMAQPGTENVTDLNAVVSDEVEIIPNSEKQAPPSYDLTHDAAAEALSDPPLHMVQESIIAVGDLNSSLEPSHVDGIPVSDTEPCVEHEETSQDDAMQEPVKESSLQATSAMETTTHEEDPKQIGDTQQMAIGESNEENITQENQMSGHDTTETTHENIAQETTQVTAGDETTQESVETSDAEAVTSSVKDGPENSETESAAKTSPVRRGRRKVASAQAAPAASTPPATRKSARRKK